MNAVLLSVAIFLPGQTYVYEAPKVVELAPAQRTRCNQLLAEMRANRQDQIDRMMEDAEIRLQWTGDRQTAVAGLLAFESDNPLLGKTFDDAVAPAERGGVPAPKVQFSSALSRPRHSSLADLRARQRQLVRVQKQTQVLQWQRGGVERFQNRQGQYRFMEAAAGFLSFYPR